MGHFCFVSPPLADLPIPSRNRRDSREPILSFSKKEYDMGFISADEKQPIITLRQRYCRFVLCCIAAILLVFYCASLMYLSTASEETDLPLYRCLHEKDLATRTVFKIHMETSWRVNGTALSEIYIEAATMDRRIVASGMLTPSTSMKNIYSGNVRAFIDKFENWFLMRRSFYINKTSPTPFMEDYIQLQCNFMVDCGSQPLLPHRS